MPSPLESEDVPSDVKEASLRVLRGWLCALGPVTARSLASRLALPIERVEGALRELESEGFILRGNFLAGEPYTSDAPHWCERSALARIHRLTLGRLRREIEPVSAADLLHFLFRWQHALPGARLHGPRGLIEVLAQLQGFHAAAGAWEKEILPARVAGYDPAWLDQLCLSGEAAWGRLVTDSDSEEIPRRRNAPTRNAPVTLLLRQDLPWLLAAASGSPVPLGPSAQGLVDVLSRSGACFASDLALMTGRLPLEVEQGLWELVSAGVVTCDLFAGLRALIEPRSGHRPRRSSSGAGRWALLRRPDAIAPKDALERIALQYLLLSAPVGSSR